MRSGVMVVDEALRVRTLNEAARDLLRTHGGVTGLSLDQFAPDIAQDIERWRQGRTSASVRMGTRDLVLRYTALGPGTRSPVLVLLEDAQRARDEAQRLKLAALGRLSASIAHEIRNPLSAITQAVELLDAAKDAQEADALRRVIHRHAKRIDGIVQDVSDISRGRPPEPDHRPLAELLGLAYRQFQEGDQACAQRVTLHLDTDAVSRQTIVHFDSDHFCRILHNLWRNSVEHGAHSIRMRALPATARILLHIPRRWQRHRAGHERNHFRALLHHQHQGHRPRPVSCAHPVRSQRRAALSAAARGPRCPFRAADARLHPGHGGMSRARVLVVDDEQDIRDLLGVALARMELEAVPAETVDQARRLLGQQSFRLCLTDMRLPDGNGIQLVETIQQHYPGLPVAVITAYGNAQAAVDSLKAGAFDFVSKPLQLEDLRRLVDDALKLPGAGIPEVDGDGDRLIGDAPAMQQLRALISRVARSQAPLHISGESGTGKERVARLVHQRSARKDGPFVPVNCGAIPSELMESELFGHIKGAFTGALQDNEGLFRAAEGGTLFLDEVAELPLPMQVKLLRAIQERVVRPVGARDEQPVNVRIHLGHQSRPRSVRERGTLPTGSLLPTQRRRRAHTGLAAAPGGHSATGRLHP